MPRADDETPEVSPKPGVDRRLLLGGAVAAAATGAFFWLRGSGVFRGPIEPTAPGAERRSLTGLEWATLDAAQQRILPSAEGSPGAKDVNAIGYLDALLQDPAIEEESVARTLAGAARLNAFALERGAGADGYAALPGEVQDEGLHLFDEPWDQQLFLRGLISYTLEAFFCDPVHGGNPDEVAWAWADHRPGFPRPTPDWQPLGKGPANSLDR